MKEEDPGRTEAGNKASRCHVTGDGEAVHVVSEESSSSKPRWRREKMIRERRKISKKAKRCQVHGVILQRMLVPVIYGRPVDDTSFETLIKSRADLFPNGRVMCLGVARWERLACTLKSRFVPNVALPNGIGRRRTIAWQNLKSMGYSSLPEGEMSRASAPYESSMTAPHVTERIVEDGPRCEAYPRGRPSAWH